MKTKKLNRNFILVIIIFIILLPNTELSPEEKDEPPEIRDIVNELNEMRLKVGAEALNEIRNSLNDQVKRENIHFDNEDIEEDDWSDYDADGCPIKPFVFSGMTGRLGNVMSTYANMITFHWRLGYKYFLPLYMNHHSAADLTKPYLSAIFKNVSFPTATWSNITVARDANPDDRVLFNNSRTKYQLTDCNKDYMRERDVYTVAQTRLQCTMRAGCLGQSCDKCGGEKCGCGNLWITYAGGANYMSMRFVHHVLRDIVLQHFQFQDDIAILAKTAIDNIPHKVNFKVKHYVGIHVRRTDFQQYSKFWLPEIVNETFWNRAIDYYRNTRLNPVFLVVSDDIKWCREKLVSADIVHMSGNSPEVDLAIMAGCNSSIIDYGTYSLWSGVLAGGEVVVPRQTFRDVRWAADYLGWTYF